MDGKLILLDGSSVPADSAAVKKALTDGTLLWLDLHPPGDDGLALLRDVFELHPIAIEHAAEFGLRPKIEDFGTMVYLVSYGVSADDKTLTEVHFFVAEHYLVTIRRASCPSLEVFRDRLDEPGGKLPTGNRPIRLILLHHLIDSLIDSFFPALAELRRSHRRPARADLR